MDERGYGSVLVLALLLGGVLLAGLAADISRLVTEWREVSYVAHTAAEVGAGWVDPQQLYSGRLVVDIAAAADAAAAFARAEGHQADVAATRSRVCVAVSSRVEPGLIRVLGASARTVTVTACAEPRQG